MTVETLSQSDIDAIGHARDGFVAAMGKDDVDGMMALLSEDGQAFPPHEPALIGADANRAWHQARIADFETHISISSKELVGEGSMAFERFTYTLRVTPRAGGDAVEDTGNCVWLWRRGDAGSWRVARAMWNSPKFPGS